MRLKNVSQDTQQILEEFNRTYKEAEKKEEEGERVADKFNAVSQYFYFLHLYLVWFEFFHHCVYICIGIH